MPSGFIEISLDFYLAGFPGHPPAPDIPPKKIDNSDEYEYEI
jgi:hypothetical protein